MLPVGLLGSAPAPAVAASPEPAPPLPPLDTGGDVTPDPADRDGDRVLHLRVGEGRATRVYFDDTRGSAAPAFAAANTNPFGRTRTGYPGSPEPTDVDGD